MTVIKRSFLFLMVLTLIIFGTVGCADKGDSVMETHRAGKELAEKYKDIDEDKEYSYLLIPAKAVIIPEPEEDKASYSDNMSIEDALKVKNKFKVTNVKIEDKEITSMEDVDRVVSAFYNEGDVPMEYTHYIPADNAITEVIMNIANTHAKKMFTFSPTNVDFEGRFDEYLEIVQDEILKNIDKDSFEKSVIDSNRVVDYKGLEIVLAAFTSDLDAVTVVFQPTYTVNGVEESPVLSITMAHTIHGWKILG